MNAHRLTPVVLLAIAGASGADSFPATLDVASLARADGFVVNGAAFWNFSGYSVASAGDVNGDGFDDLVIGAPAATYGGESYAGASYVVFGGPGVGASGAIELSSLDGSNGFAIGGGIAVFCGASVSGAGDVNGDGFDDLILGAPYAEQEGIGETGGAFLVFGGADVGAAGAIDLASLDGTNGVALLGVHDYDSCGAGVSGAGDVNGDGIDDVIIGAPFAYVDGSYPGQAYVVFGRDTGVVGDFPASIALGGLSGGDGFVVTGASSDSECGASVSGAGDVNADGIDDFIVGDPEAAHAGLPSAGDASVVFGAVGLGASGTFDLSTLDGTNGFVLRGGASFGDVGASVGAAGDVNADGLDDVIVGGVGVSGSVGAAYVVFGRDTASEGDFPGAIDATLLDGTDGFAMQGMHAGENFGFSVCRAGDVSGDGVADIIIGAPYGASDGDAYVVFGASDIGASGTLSMAALDGSNGFVADGSGVFGRSVAFAGDIDADGLDDIVIGAHGGSPDGLYAAGQSFVIYGREVCVPSPVDAGVFRAHGVADGLAGMGCVAAADLDHDGDADVIVAGLSIEWRENLGGSPPAWGAHVLSTPGEGGAFFVTTSDLDADGDLDVLTASAGGGDSIDWFENDGQPSPTFTRRLAQDGLAAPRCVQAADLDGDGDLDLAAATTGDNSVCWLESDGASPPSFQHHVIATQVLGARFVAPGDLDGDADIDLVYTAPNDDMVGWLENLGGSPLSFANHVLLRDPDGPAGADDGIADGAFHARTADLDGDRDLDLIVACFGSDRVLALLNDGQLSPSFSVRTVASGTDARSVCPIDVDGDCDIDIVHAGETDHLVAWHENDGGSPPAWTMHVATELGPLQRWADAADFDGDGAIDIVSANPDAGWVAWYQSGYCRTDLDGDRQANVFDFGVFSTAFGTQPGLLSGGDLDADGDVDVFDFAVFATNFGCVP